MTDGRFAYDNSGLYGEATTFLLTGGPIKYLCAVLNSKLVRWCLASMAPTSGMGTLRWKKVYVEQLPIPKISSSDQRPFDQMIDGLLSTLAHEPKLEHSGCRSRDRSNGVPAVRSYGFRNHRCRRADLGPIGLHPWTDLSSEFANGRSRISRTLP